MIELIPVGVIAACVLLVAVVMARDGRRSRGSYTSGGDTAMTPWIDGGSGGD